MSKFKDSFQLGKSPEERLVMGMDEEFWPGESPKGQVERFGGVHLVPGLEVSHYDLGI